MSGLARLDVKQALRAYVLGHDAGIDPAAKEEWARSSLGAGGEPNGSAEVAPPIWPDPRRVVRSGVPVPARLAFHRSASRWRERLPGFGSQKSGGV